MGLAVGFEAWHVEGWPFPHARRKTLELIAAAMLNAVQSAPQHTGTG